MDYKQTLEWIHSHKRFAPQPTLERIKKLMALLGDPQKHFSVVHIAGTNGKGSTAAMTAEVLREAGYRVGLTVSPYIINFRERIQISGEMISEESLAILAGEVVPFAAQVEDLTEFELVTALAFLWFAQQHCRIVVAEVGLGGQYDATNVIEPPSVAVITKIGLDHTEILGETVEKIASEKAFIIKPGCEHVIAASNQPKGALDVIRERCHHTGCRLTVPQLQEVELHSMTLEGESLCYQGQPLRIPLAGSHQVENALTVVEICRALGEMGFDNVMAALESGIAKTRFPARMEIIRREPLVLVDGAHNPDGALALVEALSLAPDQPLIAVMGMVGDKDTEKVAAVLSPRFSKIICTTPDTPRAMAAETLGQLCKQYCNDVTIFDRISEACARGLSEAKQQAGALVVCGSFYLAAPARQWLIENHEQ